MRQRQRPWRATGRRMVLSGGGIIGVVWTVPSHEAAREAILRIRQMQYELKPGPLIEDATLFAASDDIGHCVIVVAIGKMFDATFLARCGGCMQTHGGALLPDSKRKKDFMS